MTNQTNASVPVIETNSVTKRFGGLVAVSTVDITIMKKRSMRLLVRMVLEKPLFSTVSPGFIPLKKVRFFSMENPFKGKQPM